MIRSESKEKWQNFETKIIFLKIAVDLRLVFLSEPNLKHQFALGSTVYTFFLFHVSLFRKWVRNCEESL